MWMTADFVVEESLRAFNSGELFVIPGWRYRLLVVLTPSRALGCAAFRF